MPFGTETANIAFKFDLGTHLLAGGVGKKRDGGGIETGGSEGKHGGNVAAFGKDAGCLARRAAKEAG